MTSKSRSRAGGVKSDDKAPVTRLLAFYFGSHPDDRGRMLAEILKQDDVWLEISHDYIQWLFPLNDLSRVNPGAPLVDARTAALFGQDEILRQHLTASYVRMLAFFGLRRMADGQVVKSTAWDERKSEWFTRDSHNSLRITRILKSLTLLGLLEEAVEFQRALEGLCSSEADCGVNSVSQGFWREAVEERPMRPGVDAELDRPLTGRSGQHIDPFGLDQQGVNMSQDDEISPHEDAYQSAVDAFVQGRHDEAFRALEPLAQGGFAPAQHHLGMCFLQGVGTAKDVDEAFRWISLSAGQGEVISIELLGWLHLQGVGVPRSASVAVEWFRQALDTGSASAASSLARIFQEGHADVAQDWPTAIHYWETAVALGHTASKQHLAWLYAEGIGVERDQVRSLALNVEAASEGDVQAAFNAGVAYEYGRGTPVEFVEARRWYAVAAHAGIMYACHNLGALYFNGRGGPQDLVEAKKWYLQGAVQGSVLSRRCLGLMQQSGDGVEADDVRALAWFLTCPPGEDAMADSAVSSPRETLTQEEVEEAMGLAAQLEQHFKSACH